MVSVPNNGTNGSKWADFPEPPITVKSVTFQNEIENPETSPELTPPILTLPLEHYKMIAEKVFISYLRSYRKLYSGRGCDDKVPIEKVCTLGRRLRAFLTIVIPSHADYGSPDHSEATKRIENIVKQLEDYCKELDGESNEHLKVSIVSVSFMKPDEIYFNVLGTKIGLQDSEPTRIDNEFGLDECGADKDSTFSRRSPSVKSPRIEKKLKSSEALSFSSCESTIFGDLISESGHSAGSVKGFDCKSDLKLSSSEDQTFCSSEGSTFGSTSMMVDNFDDNQFKVIQSSPRPSLEDSHSVSFSECSAFDNSVNWDTSSISVRGQIGSFYRSSESICDPSDVAATKCTEFECDGNWNNDTSSCESIRTDFESLMKLWKEKDRDSKAST